MSKRVLSICEEEPDGSWNFWLAQPLYTKFVSSMDDDSDDNSRVEKSNSRKKIENVLGI